MEHGMQKKVFRSGRRSKAWFHFWPANVQRRKAALIIGMNYTDHMNLEHHQAHYRDVDTMAGLLKSAYDFDSTVVLSDKEGTREDLLPTQANIMRELESFIPSNPRSDYFFVFQGHSSKGIIDAIGIHEEREAEYIIPYDGIDPQTDMVDLDRVITDQTLHKFLVADLPKNSQLVALFDSCNAGTLLDLEHRKRDQIQESNSLTSFLRCIRQTIMTKKRPPEIMPRAPRSQGHRLHRHFCNDVDTSVSWFAGSHRFTIAGGHFYSSNGPLTINQVPAEDSRQYIPRDPFLGVNLIQPNDIHLQQEIHKGQGYRFHTGENGGKAVLVKVFEGRHAKKTSLETANFNKKVMHPCFLRMIAAASGTSDLSFLVFSGDYRGTVESIMRFSLLQSLEKSFILGLQTAVALSSGLSYLRDIDYPILETEPESFILLLTHLDTVIISFDPERSNFNERRRHVQLERTDARETRPQCSKGVVDLFSDILQKTFHLPCEDYYNFIQGLPDVEQSLSGAPEPNVYQLLNESPTNDRAGPGMTTRHDDRLSLPRISHDIGTILKFFLLDPSLDRHHGRPVTFKKISGCCRRCTKKGDCLSKCAPSTRRKGCLLTSRCPEHSCHEEESTPRKIYCLPSVDVVPHHGPLSSAPSASTQLILPALTDVGPSHPCSATMVEVVAELLGKDPYPTYRQIMQVAMAHIWMSMISTQDITQGSCG